MLTYCLSVSCVLYRRLKYAPGSNGSLPPARWTLGKYGVPINIAAILYSAFAFFWTFWPQQTPVNASDFNYAVVIFIAVWILALVLYWFKARFIYTGPVVDTEEYRQRVHGHKE
jgi:choline transport protein